MVGKTTKSVDDVERWRDSVVRKVNQGERFVGLYGAAEDASCRVTAIVAKKQGYETVDVSLSPNADGALEYRALSTDIAPAFWYERALHDLSGVVPVGHPRLDPLLLAVETGSERPQPGRQEFVDLKQSATPHGPVDVSGRGMFTLPFGPIRSGVFESIEFLIESPGEEIPHLNIRPHFKHRGIAKKFEGKSVSDGVLVAERVEGIASIAHALAFAHATEHLARVTPPPRARLIRVIHAELERIANHLDVAMRLSDAAGLAVATARFAWHKESTMRLVSRMSGSRFGRGVVVPGGVSREPLISAREFASSLVDLRGRITADAVLAMHTPSFLDRLRGTGRLGGDYAKLWGLVGPLARASGSREDVRWSHPSDAYGEIRMPDRPALEDDGDVMARLRVRWVEIDDSVDIALAATNQLDDLHDGPVSVAINLAGISGRALGWAEGPQGEMLHELTVDDGLIQRCFARSASLHNLVAFHDAFPADVFTDFAFIEASFGLGYAGVAM